MLPAVRTHATVNQASILSNHFNLILKMRGKKIVDNEKGLSLPVISLIHSLFAKLQSQRDIKSKVSWVYPVTVSK